MMHDGKWFSSLAARTPLHHAAVTVLVSRAETVRERLVQVLQGPREDPEDVHQLRVASRRFAAALSIFADCLPRRQQQRLSSLARDLRRASGDLRDQDVLEQMLRDRLKTATHSPSPIHSDCASALTNRRQIAQRELLHVGELATPALEKSLAKMKEHLANGQQDEVTNDRTLGQAGGGLLRKRLKKLRRAARQDLNDLDNLHQLRITAKRLRYAMEVFASCYPVRFRRKLYRQVEQIQETLGHINDLRNLLPLLRVLRRELRNRGPRAVSNHQTRRLKAVKKSVERELETCRRSFRQHWSAAKLRRFCGEFKEMLKNRLARRQRVSKTAIARL